MKQLEALYAQWKGEAPRQVEQLPGAGSNRLYYRMTDAEGNSVIGVVGTSRDENHAFVYLTRHFTQRQLPVPAILAVSSDELRCEGAGTAETYHPRAAKHTDARCTGARLAAVLSTTRVRRGQRALRP